MSGDVKLQLPDEQIFEIASKCYFKDGHGGEDFDYRKFARDLFTALESGINPNSPPAK